MTEEERLAAEAAQRAIDEAAAAEAARLAAAANEGQDDLAAQLEALRAERDAAIAAAAAAADKFKGIDPEKAKADAKKVADAEKAARDAEAEKAKAEGNFERLRELQNEEHQASIAAARAEAEAAKAERAQAIADAAAARREAAFGRSQFFVKETIYTAEKAQRLYGDYVEIEEGQAVVYDAPKTAPKRAKFMDAKGNPLPFDVAMKKIVEAEPDKDTVLRSKINPGGGSKTTEGKTLSPQGDRLARMTEGLRKLRGQ